MIKPGSKRRSHNLRLQRTVRRQRGRTVSASLLSNNIITLIGTIGNSSTGYCFSKTGIHSSYGYKYSRETAAWMQSRVTGLVLSTGYWKRDIHGLCVIHPLRFFTSPNTVLGVSRTDYWREGLLSLFMRRGDLPVDLP